MQAVPHSCARRRHGRVFYRTREDVEAWKQRCPLTRLRIAVNNNNAPSTANNDDDIGSKLDAIDEEVAEQVRKAGESAQASSFPAASTATAHIYASSRRILDFPLPTDDSPIKSFTAATHEVLEREMVRNPTIWIMGEV